MASTTTTTASNFLPEQINTINFLHQLGRGVAQGPYQPYNWAPRIAQFTPDEMQAFQQVRGNMGAYQPYLNEARGLAQFGGSQFPNQDISRYINPFQQNVIDIAKREAVRGDQIAGRGRDAQAQMAGAFGGSRHGVMQAEAERNLGQRLDDMQLQGSAAAYDRALDAYNKDATRALAASQQMQGLGNFAQTAGLTDASALEAIGQTQQGKNQANLDLLYSDFLEQRDWQKNQLNFLNSLAAGTPLASTGTTSTQKIKGDNPSLLQNLAGAATAAAGIGKLFKLFNEGGPVKYANGGSVKNLSDLSLGELMATRNKNQITQEQYMSELERRQGPFSWKAAQDKVDAGARGLAEVIQNNALGQALSRGGKNFAEGLASVVAPPREQDVPTVMEVSPEESDARFSRMARGEDQPPEPKARPRVVRPAKSQGSAQGLAAVAPEAVMESASMGFKRPEVERRAPVDLPASQEEYQNNIGLALLEAGSAMLSSPQTKGLGWLGAGGQSLARNLAAGEREERAAKRQKVQDERENVKFRTQQEIAEDERAGRVTDRELNIFKTEQAAEAQKRDEALKREELAVRKEAIKAQTAAANKPPAEVQFIEWVAKNLTGGDVQKAYGVVTAAKENPQASARAVYTAVYNNQIANGLDEGAAAEVATRAAQNFVNTFGVGARTGVGGQPAPSAPKRTRVDASGNIIP